MLAGHAELRTEMCTILAKLAVRPAPRKARRAGARRLRPERAPRQGMCDGVRCDMGMLLCPEILERCELPLPATPTVPS
jgi:hypothetical protein